ncbi:MAG: hypothetical protein ACRCUX_14400 [Beijerinckiaceae bacterium]
MTIAPRFCSGLAVLFGLTLLVQPVQAQTSTVAPPASSSQSNSGIGPATPSKAEVQKDESAILPSAEGHRNSAAPTMIRDCQKNPQDCTEGVTQKDKDTAKGEQSK